MTRILLALVGLVPLPSLAASAHERPWALPAGVVVASPPAVSRPVDGPILFSEPEFPNLVHCEDIAFSTLNGTPIGATTMFDYLVGGLPSAACAVAPVGPPTQTFVNPPGLEGPAPDAQLTMDFGLDVTRVSFGFAFQCLPPETPSVTVTAIDSGGGTVGTITVLAITGGPFVENQAVLMPPSVFRRVRVDFNASAACPRFFLDNLAYPPLVTPVELQGFTVE